MEDVTGRRDGVGTVEEVAPGQLAGSHEPQRRGFVAGDVAVRARRERGWLDPVVGVEELGGLAEGVAGLEGAQVGLGDDRPGRELLLDPLDGRLHGPLVEPEHEPEGEEVLGQVHLLGGHVKAFESTRVELADGDLEDVVVVERAVRQRIVLVAGLGQVLLVEGVLVDDDGAAARDVVEVGPQRRRVHGHQHVRRVPRGVDLRRGEADLEAGDARQRARRGTDLGGEVRQRGDVVAEDGGGARELRAGQLHPVA